jgi:hypothetical protein
MPGGRQIPECTQKHHKTTMREELFVTLYNATLLKLHLTTCFTLPHTVKSGVSFRHSLRHRNSASASVVSSVKTTLLSLKTTLGLSYRVLEMTL